MRAAQIAQLVVGVLVAATPWCVVRIAWEIAARHAHSVQGPSARPSIVQSLGHLTVVVMAGVGIAAVILPAPSLWMTAVDLTAFAALAVVALRALHRIDQASRPAREVASAVRTAGLRSRRVSDYISPAWRVGMIGATSIGLTLFAWRLSVPTPDRRLITPLTFAIGAAVFAWLFSVWIRNLTTGGDALGGETTGCDALVWFAQCLPCNACSSLPC
jgi:hypothetical protein